MRTATAVIGAGFGDEGKGLMTDYLACRGGASTLVVRHSGGANSGHTVVTPDRRRHVFHHFGSGVFARAATFLGQRFIVNPLLWRRERDELHDVGEFVHDVSLMIDPRAYLSTPYDMLLNQEAEIARGVQRHGSCGLGINETQRRCARGFVTTVNDLHRPDALRSALKTIREDYVPSRLLELGHHLSVFGQEMLDSDNLFENYLEACRDMQHGCGLWAPADLLNAFQTVIFEGSQGLLLDRNRRDFFPHVTDANTGLRNAIEIATQAGIEAINAVYVTRAYATRHGAGPFEEEPGLRYHDDTNVDHQYQGSIRFGHLDLDLISDAVVSDYKSRTPVRIYPCLAMTHLDQVGPRVTFKHKGVVTSQAREFFAETTAISAGVPLRYVSVGPTRNDVVDLQGLSLDKAAG